jgi:hypothetical protein
MAGPGLRSRLLTGLGVRGKRARGKRKAVEELNTFFSEASDCMTCPLVGRRLSDLDFVLETRNLKNYFHFVRDTFAVCLAIGGLKNFNGRIVSSPRCNSPPS